jgi:hypothetical protein
MVIQKNVEFQNVPTAVKIHIRHNMKTQFKGRIVIMRPEVTAMSVIRGS